MQHPDQLGSHLPKFAHRAKMLPSCVHMLQPRLVVLSLTHQLFVSSQQQACALLIGSLPAQARERPPCLPTLHAR